jgi:hypothetical protein
VQGPSPVQVCSDERAAAVRGRHSGVGGEAELSSGPDAHNDVVRCGWTLRGDDDDGGAVVSGVDFATVAENGRLREVTGFLEPA